MDTVPDRQRWQAWAGTAAVVLVLAIGWLVLAAVGSAEDVIDTVGEALVGDVGWGWLAVGNLDTIVVNGIALALALDGCLLLIAAFLVATRRR